MLLSLPNINPENRQNVLDKKVNPYGVRGFTSAECCFLVSLSEPKGKLNTIIQLVFQLTQHSRDEGLMLSFINFF